MSLALRHPVSSGLVILAMLATLATLTVARPQYVDPIRMENVDLSQEPHFTVDDVRAAFAAQGISLRHASAGSGTTWLGATPGPWSEVDLYAVIMPTKGTAGIGHGDFEDGYFEQRAGNVIVHYGGSDTAMLERVQAVLATLSPPGPHLIK